MPPIGNAPPLAQSVPSPAFYAEVASSPVSPSSIAPPTPSSPDSTSAAWNLEAEMNDGILRALLLRRTERQERARACPENPEHALAEAVMRGLKRYLGQPLFIIQTGDGAPSRWASDAWIPDEVWIAANCADPCNWLPLEKSRVPGKTNMNHVRLQFSVDKGIPSFSIVQVENRKIRVSEAIELPPGDPRALCRAVATAKLARANWSRRPLAAGDEDARNLEETLLRTHIIDSFMNRMANWLYVKDAEAATPHPGNARPRPAPP